MKLSVGILLILLLGKVSEGISPDNNPKTRIGKPSSSSEIMTPPSVSISSYIIQNRRLFSPAVNQNISSLSVMDECVGYLGKRKTGNLKKD